MKKHNQEERALQINLMVSVIYIVISIVFVYLAQSITVFLDAGYSFIAILIYAISLYVIKKIKQPANKKFPYGYHKIEPVFVIIEAFFILLVAVIVIITAILNLFSVSIQAHYGFALLAELIGSVICLSMFHFIKTQAKKTGSRILAADAELWKADAILSLGVIVGIGIGFILEKVGLYNISLYVDSILAIILGLIILIKPIKLIKESSKDILDGSPDQSLVKELNEDIYNSSKEHKIGINNIKNTQSGRFIFIDIFLDLPQNINKSKVDILKKEIEKRHKRNFNAHIIKHHFIIA